MISSFIAASLVAATALGPQPDALGAQPDVGDRQVNLTVPLVRETITPLFTVEVKQTCPESNPYVHQVGWGWTQHPHDWLDFWNVAYGGAPAGQPATVITGLMTNWDLFAARWTEANTLCTSDVGQAMRVPQRRP